METAYPESASSLPHLSDSLLVFLKSLQQFTRSLLSLLSCLEPIKVTESFLLLLLSLRLLLRFFLSHRRISAAFGDRDETIFVRFGTLTSERLGTSSFEGCKGRHISIYRLKKACLIWIAEVVVIQIP